MSIDYAYGKIENALDGMVTSPLCIQDRLFHACRDMGPIGHRDFPNELADQWASFYADVTAIGDAEGGAYRASTREMTDEEASEVAQKLVELCSSVRYFIKDRDTAAQAAAASGDKPASSRT